MIEPPRLLRGTGWDSGSAQLLILVAMQNPGVDVLCSAPLDRLNEMCGEVLGAIDETVTVLDRSNVKVVQLANMSRIIFRTPRRDGAGARGINPVAVWLDGVDRFGETEAVESVNRAKPIRLIGGEYCSWCGARVAEFGHDDYCPNPTG